MDIGLSGALEEEGDAVGVGEGGLAGECQGDVLTVVDGVGTVAGKLAIGFVQIYRVDIDPHRAGVVPRRAAQGVARGGVDDGHADCEGAVGGAPEVDGGLYPTDIVVDESGCHCVGGGESFVEVQFVAALIAGGAHHEEALGVLRMEAIHHAVERRGAVMGTRVRAEAHVDDAGFAHRGGIGANIGDAVVDAWKRGHTHHHNVSIGSHTTITAADAVGTAAAGGDACDVGAVEAVGVVGLCRKYLALGGELTTVAVARRGGAHGVALYPGALDAQGGTRRVVEGGVSVLETTVDDAHHHAGAVVAVGQVDAAVDVVDAQLGTGVLELLLRLAPHVEPRAEARLGEGHIVVQRDADGQHIADARLHMHAIIGEGFLVATEFSESGDICSPIDIDKAVLLGHLFLVEAARLEVGHQQGAVARHETLLCGGHRREGQQHNNKGKNSLHCFYR